MFGFGKQKKTKAVKALIDQCLGGQSQIYRIFIETLKVPPDKVKKIELTYFSLSVLTFFFLRISKDSDKVQIINDVASCILTLSIPGCGEEISREKAVADYNQRYNQYGTILASLLSEPHADWNLTLLMQLYNCVYQDNPGGVIKGLTAASSMIIQYFEDDADFIKNKM
jgi:hypothetical protein